MSPRLGPLPRRGTPGDGSVMSDWYALIDREVVGPFDIHDDVSYRAHVNRRHEMIREQGVDPWRVAVTELPNGGRVSTVFLGLDHNYSGVGPPIVFETMIFP